MVGLSTPSGEHSHRAGPPPDPSVLTPCREAPAPELPVRFAAARIDRQAAACRQRIVTDRVREEGKCAPPPGFCPGYLAAVEAIGCPEKATPARRVPGGTDERIVRMGSPRRLLRHGRV